MDDMGAQQVLPWWVKWCSWNLALQHETVSSHWCAAQVYCERWCTMGTHYATHWAAVQYYNFLKCSIFRFEFKYKDLCIAASEHCFFLFLQCSYLVFCEYFLCIIAVWELIVKCFCRISTSIVLTANSQFQLSYYTTYIIWTMYVVHTCFQIEKKIVYWYPKLK